jgi:hypothetical protein
MYLNKFWIIIIALGVILISGLITFHCMKGPDKLAAYQVTPPEFRR